MASPSQQLPPGWQAEWYVLKNKNRAPFDDSFQGCGQPEIPFYRCACIEPNAGESY